MLKAVMTGVLTMGLIGSTIGVSSVDQNRVVDERVSATEQAMVGVAKPTCCAKRAYCCKIKRPCCR